MLLALVGAAVTSIAVSSRAEHPTRDIKLVARGMTYYIEGSTVPNPTLVVGRGEQVRIVLRNGDPGMIHDFGIDAWSLRTQLVDDKGKEDGVLQFRAPDRPGDTVYSCTPHAQMMRGTIRVE